MGCVCLCVCLSVCLSVTPRSRLKMNNIKNDIFKKFKNSKVTSKTPQNQKVNNFKKSHKEASNSKILKTQKLLIKHIKPKKSIISKSHLRRPQIKKSKNTPKKQKKKKKKKKKK